ncbi:S8 family serine peptidase [Pseudonocardia kunmingensis]|uniref:Subtilase family protein n=1 Tax=Pseudonocardia kunmingensis TaxID=630975 RepID=A0A543D1A6_9PSEU|nr:S8 family serine peptidase [Pseudonocardia kunmingensis]TQM03119.1 subtilase family protein [Pseudonocardia kunmingensis]
MKSPRAFGRAVVAAVALVAVLGAASLGAGSTAPPQPTAAPVPAPSAPGTAQFTVLLDAGAEGAGARDAAVAAVEAAGGHVLRENAAVGALVVEAPVAGFVERVSAAQGIFGATPARPIGSTAATGPRGAVPAGGNRDGQGPAGLDPLDTRLWGLSMIKADAARAQQPGDPRVHVGILDTGIDASNPDLAPNLDVGLSRNFVTDIPTDPTGGELDGPCEFDGCVDPPDHDGGGHGTHVAGTVAAAANGSGLSGVAPGVTLVNIRAGQDAGLFFLQPVVDALTYGADIGLDVINMSFYVDPWRYNCTDNPADSSESQIAQRTIIEAMTRALEYAHGKGVTLVGSLGNEREDLGRPGTDRDSPNYPPGAAYDRAIDNASCVDLPVEGPHVIGVSAVGPSGAKAEYSNYGTEQISVAAPGGSASAGRVEDLILSSYPQHVLQESGDVDAQGEVTPQGAAQGVQKACQGSACGYYSYLQGTSMAAPHVSGVAALVVSEHGTEDPQHPGQLTMAPEAVEQALTASAAQVACPAPGAPGAGAPCEGDPAFNGHYGHGIVDALAALTAPTS